jgi:PTS system mannose-specific IID component
MNFTRMEGLSYGWALAPMLKKIYPDPHRYMEALKRNSQFFNTNQHLAPFIMGLTLSMEKENAANPNFDTSSINGIKVALMGPFAGVGDSFFMAFCALSPPVSPSAWRLRATRSGHCCSC